MKQKRLLLATRLLLSLLAVLTASTAWADSAFSGGSGTQADPYQIASTSDLNQLATDVNGGNGYSGKYFVLTADIVYTYNKAWNDASSTGNNFVAIGGYDGTNYRRFQGDFDGAGHTISGIRIHRSGTWYTDWNQGIFGQTGSGANIHGLRLADTRITGSNYTGGIVGYNLGTVTDCHVASNVCIHAAQSNTEKHGGIAGYNVGTVEGCTSAATLTIAYAYCYFYGAIAGYNEGGGTLRDNLAIGATVDDADNGRYGAIAGYNYGTLQSNYYTACNVAGAANATGKGCMNADVTANDGAVSVHTITLGEGITITSPAKPTVSYGGTDYYKSGVEVTFSNTAPAGYLCDGYTVSAGTLSGSTLTMPDEDVTISLALTAIDWATVNAGTSTDPYIIYNKDQLDLLAHRVNGTHGQTLQSDGYSGKYFRLGADITFTATTEWKDATSTENNYEAIGYYDGTNERDFKGDFDGAGYTISGIRIHRSGSASADGWQGIFGRTQGATIHGLRLADARITGYDYTGGIVGSNRGTGTVADCHVANDVCIHAVKTNAYYHGGIAGDNYGTVANCTSAATLTIPTNATSCQNYGGIAGTNYGTVANCTSTATLTIPTGATSERYGAIAGYNKGTLRDNLAIGATVPAAANNTHGAIAGNNDNNGTLQRNYYTACTVAGVENATGKGCKNADVATNDGAVSVHTITLDEGITITSPAEPTVSYGGTNYYKSGVTVTLSHNRLGYKVVYASNDVTITDDAFTMPASDVTISATFTVIDWATENAGTADDPYMIYIKDQLDLLAHRVNGTHDQTLQSDGYSGKYFRLGADIAYTHKNANEEGADTENNYEAIGYYDGTNERFFRGDFDGAGHTISGIRIHRSGSTDTDRYQGIFGQTDGANIHGLRLADARITGYDNTGGIVGYNYGGSTITDCHVASDVCIHAVNTSDSHGGIAGRNYGTVERCTSAATLTIADSVTVTVTRCWYYGAIAGLNDHGTLRDNLAIGATVPDTGNSNSYRGAIAGHNDNGTLQRNYYTACTVAGVANATGKGCKNADVATNDGAVSVHTITLGEGITITSPAEPTVTYGSTGYYKNGTTITLTNNATGAPAGYQYGYSVSAGTLSGSTLTMPAADVTISLALAAIDWATESTGDADNPYMIYNKDQLDLLAHRVNSGTGDEYAASGYSGKYFRLANDIAYTYTKAWNEATTEDDNNYEPIGYYDGENNRYFQGDFDGAGHTISGIRIHIDSSRSFYQGIFGWTGTRATIHGLRLADARITGYVWTGGIVGDNNGTVTDCHVANNVCIHTDQTDAWYHGGIAGFNNYGTVANCTSAVTLTIPSDASSCQYYGAIAGYNYDNGTLRDNLAIGATVPAATYNHHGAIVGNESGTLQRNYYTACTVAGVENATGKGSWNADVTANDGAVPALRDQASNTRAIALLAALASTDDDRPALPLDLGWGPGQFPLQLAGRTLTKSGDWNTLCLPFAVTDGDTTDDITFSGTPLEGVIVKELDATNSNLAADGTLTLTFSTVTSIEAGKPYIVKWEGASGTVADPVFEGVEISETAPVAVEFANISGLDACQFVGQYSPFSIGDTSNGTFDGDLNEIIMLGSGSRLGYSQNARTLNCFRAHFLVPTNGPAGPRAARAFVLDFGDGDNATGIISITADKSAAGGDGWYDLNGRRINGQPTAKGVYIQNGKKVVIK